jgi:predicted phage tail component-like protein
MLSIDGVHIEKDLGLHLLADSDETMMPDTRQDTLTVPGRHGAYVFNSYLEPRRFFPYILIPSQATLNDVQKIVRQVSSLLVDEYGSPKDVKLIYDYEPEKYYIARFTGYIAIDRVAKTGRFPIPFLAYDPFAYADMNAYDTDPIEYGVEIPEGTILNNTQSFEWLYERHYSGLYNHSFTGAKLSLKIEGSVNYPSITNLNTGQMMMLPSLNNGVLEIDGEKETAINGSVNAMPDFRGDFLILNGGDNSLLFKGENPNCTVTYQWKHKFV